METPLLFGKKRLNSNNSMLAGAAIGEWQISCNKPKCTKPSVLQYLDNHLRAWEHLFG
jgi:hypothetical protein